MNKVILRGHLGDDVNLKHTTTNNVPVCNIRVATNRKWTDKQGQLVEDTQWHNVVCWNKVALTTAQFMRKGSQVLIEGRLQTRSFMGQTTYENGAPVVDGAGNPIMVKRYTTEIVASSVTFLDKKQANTTYVQPAAGTVPVAAAVPAANPAVIPAGGFVVPAPGTPVVGTPVVVADPNAVNATFVQPVSVDAPPGV